MPKPKWNLNAIYISERLQESLRPISRCALTTVVAPMGYGKTTAVNWYLAEQARNEDSRVVRISVYSDNLAIFWRSVQDAFARAGFAFLQDYACPTDAASGGLLADGLCHELAGETPCYIFIDDFHLLTDRRAAAFLCTAAGRLPENVHLIVASRDLFLPAAEIVRLGSRVYQIGTGQLRLNHTELAIYAHRCGTELSDQQVETLLYYSEGWFSAVYLNLRALSERGALPDRSSDISAMFTAAMIDPLSPRQREFLAVMGLADEFTVEMARFITEDPGAETLLTGLTEQNAFVKCLPDGVTYRFHHMMKECAERAFLTLDAAKQAAYRKRYGAWYEGRRQYLHAMAAYHRSGDYDALLQVVQADAGILLASLKPADVLAVLDQCPAAVLKAHPFALLVLMRSMFNWRQIPRMLELKDLLMAAIEEHPELPAEERGNLLGECDLIMSFLCYNDISAMSRLHRSASSQMSHPAISIQKSGGWTFGSPSVLMMFYRGPGELEQELVEMDECMPHYYKITNGHGRGAGEAPGPADHPSGENGGGPAAAAAGAGSPPGGPSRPDGPGIRPGPAGGPAPEQPGDRRKAVPLRGQRPAVHQPTLYQTPDPGGPPVQAETAGPAAGPKDLTTCEWLFCRIHCTLAVQWIFAMQNWKCATSSPRGAAGSDAQKLHARKEGYMLEPEIHCSRGAPAGSHSSGRFRIRQQAADPVGPAVSDYLPEPAARNSPGGPDRQQRQQPHGVRRPGLRHQGPGGL